MHIISLNIGSWGGLDKDNNVLIMFWWHYSKKKKSQKTMTFYFSVKK